MASIGLLSKLESAWCQALRLAWPAVRRMPPRREPANHRFAIAITTFKGRYDDLFCPMLRDVAHQFADTQILVNANGHVDQAGQAIYVEKITAFCKQFPNVELTTFMAPQGLSKLWNLAIQKSRADRVMILNDDLSITPRFRHHLTRTGIFDTEVCLINNIWSHFLVSKAIIGRLGGFDESFREVGAEDDDYTFRLALAGVPLETRDCLHVTNKSRPVRESSYGTNLFKEHRYSGYNAKRLAEKWIISREPFAGGTHVARSGVYVALNPAGQAVAGSDSLEQAR